MWRKKGKDKIKEIGRQLRVFPRASMWNVLHIAVKAISNRKRGNIYLEKVKKNSSYRGEISQEWQRGILNVNYKLRPLCMSSNGQSGDAKWYFLLEIVNQ